VDTAFLIENKINLTMEEEKKIEGASKYAGLSKG
jgi:hypothetical protein